MHKPTCLMAEAILQTFRQQAHGEGVVWIMPIFATVHFHEIYSAPSRNGLTKPKKVRGSGTKLINMGELFKFDRLNAPECERAPLTAKEKENSLLEAGDLLFARQSLVLEGAGKCSIFLGDQEEVTFESHIIRIRLNQSIACPLFYYYFFKSSVGKSLILSIVEQGAGASGIRGSDLQNLLVPLPSLKTQQAIAHILGTLDDKIDLNRRMNETLEAMAHALFKSWFVDFDPVKAKIEGRQPVGMDAETAALFPDRLVESELGMIPEGWRVGILSDMLTLSYGKALKQSDRIEGPFPVYGSGGITGSHSEALVSGPGIIVGRKGTVGSIYWENNDFFPIDTTYYVEPHAGFPLVFLYELLHTLGLEKMNTDAAVPGLNRNNAYRLEVVIPGSDVTTSFDKQLAPATSKRENNLSQIELLQKTRATLLPKLISGEISVAEAEKRLGAVL